METATTDTIQEQRQDAADLRPQLQSLVSGLGMVGRLILEVIEMARGLKPSDNPMDGGHERAARAVNMESLALQLLELEDLWDEFDPQVQPDRDPGPVPVVVVEAARSVVDAGVFPNTQVKVTAAQEAALWSFLNAAGVGGERAREEDLAAQEGAL